MFDPKAVKQSKPKTPASPQAPFLEVTAVSETVLSQDQIRERAYQIYQDRGAQDGQAQQDWLAAEQQILTVRKNGQTVTSKLR